MYQKRKEKRKEKKRKEKEKRKGNILGHYTEYVIADRFRIKPMIVLTIPITKNTPLKARTGNPALDFPYKINAPPKRKNT